MQRIREEAVLKAHQKAKEETEAKAVQKRERSKCALEATMKVNQALPGFLLLVQKEAMAIGLHSSWPSGAIVAHTIGGWLLLPGLWS